MREMLDKLDEALAMVQGKTKKRPAKSKPRGKSAVKKKASKETATSAVLKVIINSRSGVTTNQIKVKTFD